MSKHNSNKQAAVTESNVTAAPALTIVQPAPISATAQVLSASQLRAKRVNAVQAALYAQRTAAKQAAHAQAQAASKQQAYLAAVAVLAAQYGVPLAANSAVMRTLNGSATNIVTKHAPSAHSGATHRVRAIAAQCNFVRSATLAACAAEGINPNTAATQYAVAKKLAAQQAA